MADLKPCPFCGSTPKHGRYTTHGKKWECRNCGAMGPNHEPNTNKGEHQLWNTRPLEDAKDATIERMRGLLEDCRVSLKEADELVFCDTYDCELVARIDAELKGDGDG